MVAGRANSVTWNRQFGRETFKGEDERIRSCRALQQALEMVGAKRMVVGHTPQLRGCNAECDGRVWRVDIGLSRGVLGSSPQVLVRARRRVHSPACSLPASARSMGF